MAFGNAVVMGFPSQELTKWINSYFITGFLFAQEPASASEINWHLLPGGTLGQCWGMDCAHISGVHFHLLLYSNGFFEHIRLLSGRFTETLALQTSPQSLGAPRNYVKTLPLLSIAS